MFNRLTKPILTGLLCATVFLVATSTRAAEISDGAKFFSAEAVAKANLAIHDVERKTRHEIRIETIASLPEDKIHAVSKMNATERDAFFSNWVQDRAKETNSKGIVILICKKPEQIRLWAGKPLEHAGFGPAQAKPIRETILTGFKAHQFDKALSDTVTQIATVFEGLHAERTSGAAPVNTLPRHANNPPPAPVHHVPAAREANSGYGGLIIVMVVVIGGVFLFSMISRMFSGSQSGYGPNGGGPGPGPGPGPGYGGGYGYGGGGGGGGFMKGIAGGIMGAVAGNWLYNQFSGGHQAHGSDSNYTGSSGSIEDNSSGSDSGFSGGTDYGGGDFGGGGGGGDAGGDDFGGGDFGGGGD